MNEYERSFWSQCFLKLLEASATPQPCEIARQADAMLEELRKRTKLQQRQLRSV